MLAIVAASAAVIFARKRLVDPAQQELRAANLKADLGPQIEQQGQLPYREIQDVLPIQAPKDVISNNIIMPSEYVTAEPTPATMPSLGADFAERRATTSGVNPWKDMNPWAGFPTLPIDVPAQTDGAVGYHSGSRGISTF